MGLFAKQPALPVSAAEALPGHPTPLPVPDAHAVSGHRLEPPFPAGTALALFGMGCFWGAERLFWEGHDPTQGMRHGNDVGSQYRSALYWHDAAQRAAALASRDAYQAELARAGLGRITTELREAPAFYYAEAYHQQYLARNPGGYCGLEGTGIGCPAA